LIEFPEVARPDVTVIMATHGASDWARRSLHALRDRTPPRYETIVVDNPSPDGTAEALAAETHGLRILRNTTNVGFGPANNQGAAAARGRYLCFLNSDALVRPGWFEPLVDRLDGDASIAAVAPALYNLDGSVQEAGSVLFAGLETQPLREARARAVDYASAACLMVRRSAFEAVGGFDAAYGVAYYEDVDLCLALRAKGARIVVEPRSSVTHAGGRSSPPARAIAMMHANRHIAAARWSHQIGVRPSLDGPRPLISEMSLAPETRGTVR
jgi:GT2 family glycosyltransferase